MIDWVVGGEDDDTEDQVLIQQIGLLCQEIRLLASQVIQLRWELADSRLEHERQLQVKFVDGNYFEL